MNPTKKNGVNSSAPEGNADPVPKVAHVTSYFQFYQCQQYII